MHKNHEKPIIKAAFGEKPTRQPVWFMRQAGRYLPEYQKIRESVEFVDLCRNPELACEVTMQPLRRFDLDAAILFSDILIPCTAFGLDFYIDKGQGPHISPCVRSLDGVSALKHPNVVRDLGFVGETVSLIKSKLKPEQALIGFAGAPFTVASYMVEGGPSKDFAHLKKMMFTTPGVFTELLEKVSLLTYDYLEMQVNAGADMLMLFDTWLGHISQSDFSATVLPIVQKLFHRLRSLKVPLVYFPGQGAHQMMMLKNIDIDVISVDWRINLKTADEILSTNNLTCALQGNLDPLCLAGEPAFVRERTRKILEEAKTIQRSHIFNVGHGLLPMTPIKSIEAVIEEIRSWEC